MHCSARTDQTKTSSPISLTAIYSAVLTGIWQHPHLSQSIPSSRTSIHHLQLRTHREGDPQRFPSMVTLTARTNTMTTSSPISLPHLQGYTVLNEQIPDDNIVTYIASSSTRLCSAQRGETRRKRRHLYRSPPSTAPYSLGYCVCHEARTIPRQLGAVM